MPAVKNKKTLRQLVASLLVDAEIGDDQKAYVIKSPRAEITHKANPSCDCYACVPARSNLAMYGVEFTDGVGITTDKALAEKITAEFPEYKFEELA